MVQEMGQRGEKKCHTLPFRNKHLYFTDSVCTMYFIWVTRTILVNVRGNSGFERCTNRAVCGCHKIFKCQDFWYVQ
jgi:hypothetical protein